MGPLDPLGFQWVGGGGQLLPSGEEGAGSRGTVCTWVRAGAGKEQKMGRRKTFHLLLPRVGILSRRKC